MTDQIQPDAIISMESAALEFSTAYSLVVANLVTRKLELIEQNYQLKLRIAKLEDELKTTKLEARKYISKLDDKSDSID